MEVTLAISCSIFTVLCMDMDPCLRSEYNTNKAGRLNRLSLHVSSLGNYCGLYYNFDKMLFYNLIWIYKEKNKDKVNV